MTDTTILLIAVACLVLVAIGVVVLISIAGP